jgi:hypothetical protein
MGTKKFARLVCFSLLGIDRKVRVVRDYCLGCYFILLHETCITFLGDVDWWSVLSYIPPIVQMVKHTLLARTRIVASTCGIGKQMSEVFKIKSQKEFRSFSSHTSACLDLIRILRNILLQ